MVRDLRVLRVWSRLTAMAKAKDRRVWVLVNTRSGTRWSFDRMRRAVDRAWDIAGNDVCYQFCQSVEDGVAKAQRVVADGADTILLAGGDGTVNTIARTLIGSDVALGIIPVGSGNGFARHFEIPLQPHRAVVALAAAHPKKIDVGVVNRRPFLVTCSMAWETALIKSFQRSPVRGVLPYIFAGMQGLFDYTPQDLTVVLDGTRELTFKNPMIFTIANLTQYGGGVRVAPQAKADDGILELVVALKQDIGTLIANVGRLFDGSMTRMPQVRTFRFRTLSVIRETATPIQVDGELMEAPETIHVSVHAQCLKVLVP